MKEESPWATNILQDILHERFGAVCTLDARESITMCSSYHFPIWIIERSFSWFIFNSSSCGFAVMWSFVLWQLTQIAAQGCFYLCNSLYREEKRKKGILFFFLLYTENYKYFLSSSFSFQDCGSWEAAPSFKVTGMAPTQLLV